MRRCFETLPVHILFDLTTMYSFFSCSPSWGQAGQGTPIRERFVEDEKDCTIAERLGKPGLTELLG